MVWEAVLANCIIPDKSTLKMGRVRAELKLKKADPIKWSELEVCAMHLLFEYAYVYAFSLTPIQAPASVISASPKPNHLPQKTTGVPSPSNSPSLRKKTRSSAQKSFRKLKSPLIILHMREPSTL